MSDKIKVLIITGSVGVGKSSTADAISEILSSKKVPHFLADMDYFRYAYPRPENDPYNLSLGVDNLKAIWPNLKKVGVDKIIIVDIIESPEDVNRISSAIPNSKVTVVELRAKLEKVHERLRRRHNIGDENNLNWHLNRAEELIPQFEESKLKDFFVDTNNKSIKDVAEEILKRWI